MKFTPYISCGCVRNVLASSVEGGRILGVEKASSHYTSLPGPENCMFEYVLRRRDAEFKWSLWVSSATSTDRTQRMYLQQRDGKYTYS